jgi:23S rRNA (cytidine2498-2'-O)-methyltransferase
MRSRIVFSVAEDYFAAARAELLATFPGAEIERLGPDAGSLAVEDLEIDDVADACLHRPIVFVRHLMHEAERIPADSGEATIERIRATAMATARESGVGPDLALQVWTSGRPPITRRADEVWRLLAADLGAAGLTVARANRDQVLSVCLTPTAAVLGLNRRIAALVDWPGGRVKLAKDDSQVSRSEFKLEELLKVFDLRLPASAALDLGASPGGWTRVLRRHGLSVWAVDPADLDPRVAADPGVRHLRTTAGHFLRAADRRQVFDVLVNDMRMVADRSCGLMIEAAQRLKPGGLAVVTLKLTPRDALPTVARSLTTLARAYEILHARQLYHNRHEVTVVARRNAT